MQYNRIELRKMKSLYCDHEHYCILIDGVPLDEIFHRLYPEDNLRGLIPTIVEWVDEPREKAFVLSRHQSTEPRVMLPILMCPDDCDVWCTLILAEVLRMEDTVDWNRFGYKQNSSDELILDLACIGTKVGWLDKMPAMTFQRAEYELQISKLWS